jgi:hypothetical protein
MIKLFDIRKSFGAAVIGSIALAIEILSVQPQEMDAVARQFTVRIT